MSPERSIHAVTGAFGYSGKYIAKRLIDAGHEVITLTNSHDKSNTFREAIRVFPLRFDDSNQLIESLKGVRTLYNTYWVRFNYAGFSHALAVSNTIRLIQAAQRAGVDRIVHLSITNPSATSPFEYFRGKAKLEQVIIDSGISYAILRPTVLFGKEDILINNIAWTLRKLPVFGLFGDGSYKLQPIYVDDLAKIAVNQGANSDNRILNTIGPETFSYRELVNSIGRIIGKSRPTIPLPPRLAYFFGLLLGKIVGDVMITWDEVGGLMANLLCVESPPTGETRLTKWVTEHASSIGARYTNELQRRRLNL
jgi:NADH dehydrogenase